jgi:hypothetical protein
LKAEAEEQKIKALLERERLRRKEEKKRKRVVSAAHVIRILTWLELNFVECLIYRRLKKN